MHLKRIQTMLIETQWAGHCQDGTSDKVWAACLTADHQVIAVHGRRGSALRQTINQFPDGTSAKKHYDAKVAEKSQRYTATAFDTIGIPSFGEAQRLSTPASPQTAVYQVTHILPLSKDELLSALSDARYGLTEKINGERTIIAFDGHTLRAYNRRGLESSPPAAVAHLKDSPRQFVMDGERYATSTDSGCYAAFDLLELDGLDWRAYPYQRRIETLCRVLASLPNPPAQTHALSQQLPVPFSVLIPTSSEQAAQQLLEWLEQHGREGVIVRTLNAPYEAGDTHHVRKYKFRADLDAIISGIKPGLKGGSLNLALLRPRDGRLIDIGSVRSGLTENDLQTLSELLERQPQPVIRVSYLPIRTVGTKLAEPTTSLRDLRTDKVAAECTTDQLPRNAEAFDAL